MKIRTLIRRLQRFADRGITDVAIEGDIKDSWLDVAYIGRASAYFKVPRKSRVSPVISKTVILRLKDHGRTKVFGDYSEGCPECKQSAPVCTCPRR